MARIISTGFYVPPTTVKNSDITDYPEWVEENLGIRERHVAAGETSAHLAAEAAERCLEGHDRGKVDMIIVATATPDRKAPSVACAVARILNIPCMAFDLNAVCAGFIYGLCLSDMCREARQILLIGVDRFSTITDYGHRDSVFFGDGAGAVLLKNGNNIKASFCATNPDWMEGFTCELDKPFSMNGKIVSVMAGRLIFDAVEIVLEQASLEIEDIDYMVPHQPSKKLLEGIAKNIGIEKEKVLMNMDRYANTSAATIPILLAENWSKFKKGDKLLFAAIGSGWAYGAAIYEV